VTPDGWSNRGPSLRDCPEARCASRCHDDRVPLTLLIVDDHPGFRRFARELLEAEGLVVVGEAADGDSALAETERLDPDVVLLDVVLPGSDGFAVCDRLARRDAGRPAVVMISSRDAASYGDRIRLSAARGFVTKHALTAAAVAALVEPEQTAR
jgi:DNA-binding NarL/FixJ family response regulator